MAGTVDRRGFQDFLDRLIELARSELPAWDPDGDDVGRGLAAIHAHFLEILVDRLNRVPGKDQLAFLDLVGVSRLPPAAASVPVSFVLAPAAGQAAAVQAGTQLATQQTETLPPVVFETESGLNVVAARLEEAHVVDPARDQWMDATPMLSGAQDRPFAIFRGERRLLHAVHFGHARLLELRRSADLAVTVDLARVPDPAILDATIWEVSTPDGWSALEGERSIAGATVTWRFEGFAGAASLALRGAGLGAARPGRWLRWRLDRPFADRRPDLRLTGVGTTLSRERSRLELTRDVDAADASRVAPSVATATQLTDRPRARELEVASARGLRVGDRIVVGAEPAWEAATLAAVRETTLTLTRALRLDHDAGAPVQRLAGSLVPYETTVASGGWVQRSTGLEPGDLLLTEKALTRVRGIDVGVAPDHVLVNTVPADASKPFEPFGPLPKLGDALHLASADGFTMPDPEAETTVALDVTVRLGDAELQWWRWSGEEWAALDDVRDATDGFTQDGRIDLGTSVSQSRYVAVTLAAGGYQRVPAILSLRLRAGDDEAHPPAGAWTSTVREPPPGANGGRLAALDTGDTMLPFGATPVPGATFYLHLSGETGDAVLDVTLAPPPRLAWEYLGPTGWKSLAVRDGTRALTASGEVVFTVPPDLQPADLNGVIAPWVRARIAAGAYGRALELVMADPAAPEKGFLPRQGSGALNPPLVSRLAVRYTTDTSPLEVVTRNDFAWEEHVARPLAAFAPFRAVADATAALYLRLDRPLPDSGARLHAVAPLRQVTETFDPAPPAASEEAAQLAWEHWDGRAWSPLTIADHTSLLTESGGIEIVGLARMAALARTAPDLPSGTEPVAGYWVRVRRVAGGPAYDPSLTHLLLNAVEAAQATTVRDEVLGSSGGRRGETFRTSRRPVLAGQTITVREPERPPETERAAGSEQAGTDAPFDVEWTEVPTLAASGPRDRHYTIERLSGTVRFGDGKHGLIPPAGADNVVCRSYRAGGGAEGNQGAGAVAQLKSSIPYVVSVTNAVPAGGGSAAEAPAQTALRGPQTLRHRDRAVSADDFEWLAREAAGTGVAKARALSNRDRELGFAPGWTTVVIVPEGGERRPLPSAGLVRTVQDALDDRCLATLSAGTSRVNVIGPGYVPVDVHAAVVPRRFSEGEATRRDVLDALETFLHPLRGGPDGAGWPLGRDVYLSELAAALERIPRVDHVSLLELLPSAGALALRFADPVAPLAPVDFPVGSVVAVIADASSREELLRARLARPIGAGAPVRAAQAVLFQEGERVRVESGGGVAYTTVRTISGSVLEVDPFTAASPLEAGAGRVVAVERASGPAAPAGTERFAPLAQPPAAGGLVDRLRVRIVEPGDALVLRRAVDPAPVADTGGTPPPLHPFALVEAAGALDSLLRIADSHLPYSGTHRVELRGE